MNIDDFDSGTRLITIPNDSKVTEDMIRMLDDLLRAVDLNELRESILEIYLSYIIAEHEVLPANFKNIASDIYFLMDFLKAIKSE